MTLMVVHLAILRASVIRCRIDGMKTRLSLRLVILGHGATALHATPTAARATCALNSMWKRIKASRAIPTPPPYGSALTTVEEACRPLILPLALLCDHVADKFAGVVFSEFVTTNLTEIDSVISKSKSLIAIKMVMVLTDASRSSEGGSGGDAITP